MKPLTYLGFTIFSVFMQFCVMEFIHEKFHLDKESSILNETFAIIEKINRKPHGLFYRTDIGKNLQNKEHKKSVKYGNSSLDDILITTSTDTTSTVFDVFYDENTSVTEDFFTTESFYASSEFDNVTEITMINMSSTTAKPPLSKKVANKEKCFCNLLYKMCDINCCCDNDCMEEERHIFINCAKGGCDKYNKNIHFCSNQLTCRNSVSSGVLNDIFCFEKVNLPEKRVKSYFKFGDAEINASFKWKNTAKLEVQQFFKKKKYEYGDPIWLIRNESIFSMYLPTKVANNYCNGRKQMKFLINENIRCHVKLEDLYLFPTLKAIEGTKLISVMESSLNNTVLNCSSLHCTKWTVHVCDDVICGEFNQNIHAPNCTEHYCKNLVLKFKYIFYYSESKITNASLTLYVDKVNSSRLLVMQEIDVEWYVGTESIDNIIQLSGNPGYILGLPVIVSFAANNHTNNFYNRTSRFEKKLSFPHNENGKCTWKNSVNKTLLFGFNIRSKCRLSLQQSNFHKNATRACHNIQNNIKEYLAINQKIFLSPYGNPQDVNDEKWIPLEFYDKVFLYGEYQMNSKLSCYNVVTRYAYVIAYADMSGKLHQEENKIVKAIVNATPLNITFDMADLSTVLTFDIRFIDISNPITEFAGAPHINLHLPTNFFIDYPPNNCYLAGGDVILILLSSLVLLK